MNLAVLDKDGGHPACKAIITPKGEFPSLTKAAKAYGVSITSIRRYIKKRPGFEYAEKS